MRISFLTAIRCITVCAVLLAMALLQPSPTSAQSCLQDQYNKLETQNLQCTANDVRVAQAINTRNLDGTSLNQCTPGQTLNFVADFLVQTSSNKTRSNIGLYFAIGDPTVQTQALTGSCSDNIIRPGALSKCGPDTNLLCGSSHPDELDGSQFPSDNCGDTSSTDPTVCLSAADAVGNRVPVACPAPAGGLTFTGAQVVTVEVAGLTCPNTPGQNVQLPNCTSWQVPGKALQCIAATPYYPYPFDANNKPEAIPGSPSKCNCGTVSLPIIVQSPQIAVTKRCTTTDSPGTNTSCNIFPEGGPVTYTVTVTNQSNFGNITIDQVCDSVYGTVYRAATYQGAACPVNGSIPAANTTCSSATLGTISSSGTCTFSVTQDEDKTVTDVVTATGHGLAGGGSFSKASNSVTVVSHEAPTTGTIVKNYVATTEACATVRYSAEVTNTSASGTDETILLSGLFDDNVDITTTGTHVLGTTCGQASNGLGTLSQSAGAGALPTTLSVNGGKYTCQFDAKFCGGVGDIVKTPGTCVNSLCTAGNIGASCTQNSDCNVHCTGITHPDTVTATLTGDDGATEVVSLSPGVLTVNECIDTTFNH